MRQRRHMHPTRRRLHLSLLGAIRRKSVDRKLLSSVSSGTDVCDAPLRVQHLRRNSAWMPEWRQLYGLAYGHVVSSPGPERKLRGYGRCSDATALRAITALDASQTRYRNQRATVTTPELQNSCHAHENLCGEGGVCVDGPGPGGSAVRGVRTTFGECRRLCSRTTASVTMAIAHRP